MLAKAYSATPRGVDAIICDRGGGPHPRDTNHR